MQGGNDMAGIQKWMCTYCGTRTSSSRRPLPGNCPRKEKTKDGKMKPHSWVKDS